VSETKGPGIIELRNIAPGGFDWGPESCVYCKASLITGDGLPASAGMLQVANEAAQAGAKKSSKF